MARPAETLVAINEIDDSVNTATFKDGNGDPITNAISIYKVTDIAIAGTYGTIVLLDLVTRAAPANTGTRYSAYSPGSTARDTLTGKFYVKTSAIGAADAWAAQA